MAIDRRALVERHNVVVTAADPQLAMSLGNGDFAFTADITGMQTFRDFHDPALAGDPLPGGSGIPTVNTCTQTTWGWHEAPNPRAFTLSDATTTRQTPRGPVAYPDRHSVEAMIAQDEGSEFAAGAWLHANPHRLDLARVGLALMASRGQEPARLPDEIGHCRQELQMWTGELLSHFVFAGEAVEVRTVAHPTRAEIAFHIRSRLFETGQLEVQIEFPGAHPGFFETSAFGSPESHTTSAHWDDQSASISRELDATRYGVGLAWDSGIFRSTSDPHRFRLSAASDELSLVVRFDEREPTVPTSTVEGVAAASIAAWEDFWTSGAAVDLSASKDIRAVELERRIVLSQYLTAIHSAGSMPPQETGLAFNSWHGKFHLEMHFWHAAHFVLWGRPHLLSRSLNWYESILPAAQETARMQRYEGARWPKQCGPDGRESPSEIGSLLLWQQPHLLYLAELFYRADPNPKTVERFGVLVHETAAMMASAVTLRDGAYHLCAPLMPAQETYDPASTENPTFELTYWWWGLEIAQRWRERRGEERDPFWSDIQDRLARPSERDGLYAAVATEPWLVRRDHPSHTMALGFLPPTPLISRDGMLHTLRDVLDDWDWDSAWGWDFPVLAMAATRLGQPDIAVDALLMDVPRNSFIATGHNPQLGNLLPIYLPGNGALLLAVSLMIAGSESGAHPLSGFPSDGAWTVLHEGFARWP